MHRGKQCVAALFLSAALMAPIGAIAMPTPQDEHERHEDREHRIYDPVNKDYHNWDTQEDQVYRRWLEERHEGYVDYNRLDKKRQHEYWKWRHEHEHERHEDEHR